MAHKIYLHIGHGGSDSGAVGQNSLEKDITLEIGLRAEAALVSAGFKVLMSRTTDVKNQNASASANSWGAQLVLSIHCNSYTDQSASGTETLIYGRGGTAEQFANILQRAAVKAMGTKDRGVKVQNVEILRNTTAPAALLECAFISNLSDEKKLMDAKYQQAIANAIVSACLEFFDKEAKSDMDYESHWAKEYIDRAIAYGIMVGDGDGSFRPNDNLTRAEAAVIVCKIMDKIEGK